MLPIQEKVPRHAERSFRLARRRARRFGFEWHQHPECELTLIESGSGQRFVGDSIEAYGPGDLVLIGPELPHTWASHPGGRGMHSAVVVQFDADWLDDMLADTPEAGGIRRLIAHSRRGLVIRGACLKHARTRLPAMVKEKGLARVLSLLGVLDRMAHSRNTLPLASHAYDASGSRVDGRIDAVCRFIHDHITEPITQVDAAQKAHMTGPAFSRFFKRRVGMTYSRYVHELRVGRACRLLLETDMAVTEVCYASGFNNLSNFNRVFRSIKGASPREYRGTHAGHVG